MERIKSGDWITRGGLMFVPLILLAALVLTACGENKAGGLAVGDKAPDFALQSSSGEMVQLSDFAGKQPVLLYFHMAVG